jgi:hypothetical protein
MNGSSGQLPRKLKKKNLNLELSIVSHGYVTERS